MQILDIVKLIQADKIKRKMVPTHATLIELMHEAKKYGYNNISVLEEINSLEVSKTITTGDTINSKYITII